MMAETGKSQIPIHNVQFATGRQKWLGHLAMLTFSILIAGSFSIGYQAAPHIAPAALNAIRFIFATLFMAVTVFALLKRAPRFSRDLWLVLILGALMATYFILMFVALQITNPISTGAVFTLIPFMSAVFGWLFLGMVTGSRLIASLLIAASGSIWMIFKGDINALLAFEVGRGELIFLFGCACHAAYAPLVKRFNKGTPVVEFTFWTLAATTLWILVYGAGDIISTPWLDLPQIVWWAIAYLSVFTTAVTFFLVQFASMRLHASKVMSYGYLTPGVIILIEGVIGNGWTSFSVGLGAIATIIGLILLVLSPDY